MRKECKEALDTREDKSLPSADLCHLIELILKKQTRLCLQQNTLHTDTRHSHGHLNGSSICYSLHGQTQRRAPAPITDKTKNLVEIYRRHFANMEEP